MKKQIILSLLALGSFLRAEDAKLDLDSLDQRLKIAERKLELAAEASTNAKAADATVSAGPGGFVINSADKKYSLKISGVFQVDSRNYFEEVSRTAFTSNNALNNSILPRRGRFQVDAGLGESAKLRFQEDFVTGSIVDAYGELKLLPWATLRTGLFKTPLSLERWRSDPARDFVELGYTALLVTDRDSGAWLELADADQVVSLGAGVFNGSVDTGTIVTTDADDDKDVVAKLFSHPFRAFDIVPLRDFGLGVAVSSGDRNTAVAAPSYKSLGQSSVNIYGYKSTVLASGAGLRVAPQGYWFWENFSLLGEYVRSSQNYQNSANGIGAANFNDVKEATLSNEAYQVQLAWNITGEDAAFSGFKLNKESSHRSGGLQLAGRYQGLRFDEESFDQIPVVGNTVLSKRFADRRTSVSAVQSWGAALSYLPVNNVKLLLDWEESAFTDGAWADSPSATTAYARTENRPTEKILFVRAQFTY